MWVMKSKSYKVGLDQFALFQNRLAQEDPLSGGFDVRVISQPALTNRKNQQIERQRNSCKPPVFIVQLFYISRPLPIPYYLTLHFP